MKLNALQASPITSARGAGGADIARAATQPRLAYPTPPTRASVVRGDDSPAVTPASAFTIASAFHHENNLDGDHLTPEGAVVSKSNVVVNAHVVNLRRSIARAVSHAPVKVVAREYGISPREVSTLRTELGFPRVPTFLEIAKRDPSLRALVISILSGEAEAGTPAAINEIIRRMGEKT